MFAHFKFLWMPIELVRQFINRKMAIVEKVEGEEYLKKLNEKLDEYYGGPLGSFSKTQNKGKYCCCQSENSHKVKPGQVAK